MRYKLTIEYDGSAFHGWQIQENALSVQEVIQKAIYAYSHEKVTVFCGGRTDTGVHATGQVAHIDLRRPDTPFQILNAINYHLQPYPVALKSLDPVADDFHARFKAVGRQYHYHLINRRARLALARGRAWWVPKPLDALAMSEAAHYLIGYHDFTSFRASHCQASSAMKTISHFEVIREGDKIVFNVAARSFLYHQVRNMVGSLVKVGMGAWPPEKISDILKACDRRQAGPTAPPEGLYLTEIFYPKDEA